MPAVGCLHGVARGGEEVDSHEVAMYTQRNLLILVAGIALVGVGWFLPNPRVAGVVMLLGLGVMLYAQGRMIAWKRKRKG